jgi:L-serine dehydratase
MEDFQSIKEFLSLAKKYKMDPGEYAWHAEAEAENKKCDEIWDRMKGMIAVFRKGIQNGLEDSSKSASGMVGGDGAKLLNGKNLLLSPISKKAAAFAIAMAEANAKMYRIVACPTGGSCGILPAVLLTIADKIHADDDQITRALFVAAGFGKVVALKASIAGAVGGCQAECGTACAMASAAAVDLLGGTPDQMANAFSLALANILGLVCDPVGGLVEVPCVKRNGFHAVHAMVAVEMAMDGIRSFIPADEVIEAMDFVGKNLPATLKETSLGGLAITPTGIKMQEKMNESAKGLGK